MLEEEDQQVVLWGVRSTWAGHVHPPLENVHRNLAVRHQVVLGPRQRIHAAPQNRLDAMTSSRGLNGLTT